MFFLSIERNYDRNVSEESKSYIAVELLTKLIDTIPAAERGVKSNISLCWSGKRTVESLIVSRDPYIFQMEYTSLLDV